MTQLTSYNHRYSYTMKQFKTGKLKFDLIRMNLQFVLCNCVFLITICMYVCIAIFNILRFTI